MRTVACVTIDDTHYHVAREDHNTLCGRGVLKDLPDSFFDHIETDTSDAWCVKCRARYLSFLRPQYD